MDTTFKITIGEDIDNFLGNDPAAIALIDIEASQSAYEQIVAARIMQLYPEINRVWFDWGGTSDYDDWAFSQDNPYQAADDFQADLEMIEEQIYNQQDFWVLIALR